MTELFQEPPHATELSPAEREGLLQTWITNRADLNVAEEENILSGSIWARRRRPKTAKMLTEDYLKILHQKMFGEVWSWAGSYRQRESNIGVQPHNVATDVHACLDDARYWLKNETYERDEIAIRLHHRLVAVHPFPNGNGRHTRLIADLLVERLGGASFSWGGGILTDVGSLRAQYVAALKAADAHDIGPLLNFARS